MVVCRSLSVGKLILVADGQWLPGRSGLFLLLRPSGFFWPFRLKHMYLFLLFYPRKASSHHQVIHREKLVLAACRHRWLDLYFLAALWKLGQDVVDLMAAPRDSCSPLFRVSVGRGPTGFLLYSEQTFGKLCSVPNIWNSWITFSCSRHWQNNTVESGWFGD